MKTTKPAARQPRRPANLETKAAAPAVQDTGGNQLPAYLQGKEATVLHGVDASDMIMPRIKLLQSISSEVEAYEAAKAGRFWHNVLNEDLGDEFEFVILNFRKKYLLMAPLGDPRGVLARAEDGVNWKPANETFEVKLKGIKEPQKWTTKPTVRESGLADFGSSIDGDEDSKPAAVLIYEFLIGLRNRPELGAMVMSLARSQARKGKDLITKINFRAAPLQAMVFNATVIEETGDEGPYKNYQFGNAGWCTEDEFTRYEALAKKFDTYKVADEEGAANADGAELAGKKTEF